MYRSVFVLVITFIATLTIPAVRAGECVVLLHGLARSANSLLFMEWCLKRAGCDVVNLDYPSKEAKIEDPADRAIPKAFYRCRKAKMIHFVTHSLGGILLRYSMKRANPQSLRLEWSVLLGLPNRGTPVIDQLNDLPGFEIWNGSGGMQLGAGSESLPNELGSVRLEVGIIAGVQSLNALFSAIIEGPNDGKAAVESTKVDSMTDHIIMPVTHTLMMNNSDVIE